MQRLNHSDLGLGGTSGNDKREERQLVNLIIGEAIELGGSHDHGGGSLNGNEIHAGGQDADLDGDGLGSLGVVTSEHVD